MLTRFLNAIILKESTYREIAEDSDANLDAIFLVVIYTLSFTIPYAFNGTFSWIFVVLMIPLTLMEWFISVYFVSFIAERMFHGEGDFFAAIRTMGYSLSAGIFNLLALIPAVGLCFTGIIGLQMLVASIIAIRAAMNIGTLPAIVTIFLANLISSLLMGCLMVPLILIMGPETLLNYQNLLR